MRSHGPERWDVVVLHPPDDPAALWVKRVVGLPGETVEDSRRRRLYRWAARAAEFAASAGHGDSGVRRQLPAGRAAATTLAGSTNRQRLEGDRIGGCECSPQEARPEIDWLIYVHRQTHLGRSPPASGRFSTIWPTTRTNRANSWPCPT